MGNPMNPADLTQKSSTKCFGGEYREYTHSSPALGGLTAKFAVYFPPQALAGKQCPVVIHLSGLTCTTDNFAQKGGAFSHCANLGLILVLTDTSPRRKDHGNELAPIAASDGMYGEDDNYWSKQRDIQ